MPPRADHACLSKKCRQADGAAAVYELPVGSTRCPLCGSKRLQRLFNAVNIGSGAARAVDFVAEPAIGRALAQQDSVRRAAKGSMLPRMIDVSQIPSAVNDIAQQNGAQGFQGIAFQQGKSRPDPRVPADEMRPFHGQPPKPEKMLVDREFKIVRRPDGQLEAARN